MIDEIERITGKRYTEEEIISIIIKSHGGKVITPKKRPPSNVERVCEVKGSVKSSIQDKAVADWNLHDFIQYYKNKYKEKMGVNPSATTKKDISALTRVVNARDNNGRVKLMIDAYIEHEKDISLLRFTSGYIQNKLDQYFTEGMYPKDFWDKK